MAKRAQPVSYKRVYVSKVDVEIAIRDLLISRGVLPVGTTDVILDFDFNYDDPFDEPAQIMGIDSAILDWR